MSRRVYFITTFSSNSEHERALSDTGRMWLRHFCADLRRCVCECDMLKRQYFDQVESSLVESEIIMLSLMFSDQRTMRVKLMCIVSSKEVTVEQWWWWWRKSEKIALYRVNRRLSQYGDERRAEWVRTWWRTFLSSPSPSLCYIECENSNRSCWIVLLIF